jgi:excisionase family DNA binding protein
MQHHTQPVAPSAPQWLIVSEVAAILGLTPARIRAMADAGEIPALRTLTGVRLFRRDDVEVARRRRAAGQ